jgi:hypothetical protein
MAGLWLAESSDGIHVWGYGWLSHQSGWREHTCGAACVVRSQLIALVSAAHVT